MAILGQITDTEYNELEGLRNSNFSLIEKSWKHFKTVKVEETEALIFGRAFHCFILENDKFDSLYVVAPEKLDLRKTADKAIWAELEASGKTILRHEKFEDMKKMRDSLEAHPMAKKILYRSENEGAYTAEIDGVLCKCKVDLINHGFVFDLKTCLDASPEGFRLSVGQRKYHRQAAFYSDILERNGIAVEAFIFVAIEKTAPYNVGVYKMDLPSIDVGRTDYERLVKKVKFHNENENAFDGYSPNVELITAPNWIFMNEQA